MRSCVLLIVLSCGCDALFLDPHGSASLCAASHPVLQPAVDEAVSYWVQAGLPSLRSCAPGSIEVQIGVPTQANFDAQTSEDNSGTIHIVVLSKELTRADSPVAADKMLAATVLAHELGHAFGLPHSPDPQSVMYWDSASMATPVNASDVEFAKELLAGIHPAGPGGFTDPSR